jgi:hypothetical protein
MIFLEYLDSFVKKINFIEALSNSDCNMHAIKEQEALAKVKYE